MATVQSIIERKPLRVINVGSDATVLDAAKMMNEYHIGALVVTQGERVVGIFTERDVLNRVVACGVDPATTQVKEVMTAPVAVCAPDTTVSECRAVMRHRRIRHLPVVEHERLVGMISIGDIVEDSEAKQKETIQYLYEYMLGEWKDEDAPKA